MIGCQSTRHTVNSSPGRLVTRSTRHPVNSSRSRLVTKRRSTRHKQTTNTHQSRTAAAVITLARSPRSPPLLNKKLIRRWDSKRELSLRWRQTDDRRTDDDI